MRLRIVIVQKLVGNQETIEIDGRIVLTLKQILPATAGLKVLFVGKRPALESVAAGHYFQGRQGTAFWNRLTKGVLPVLPDDRIRG